MQPLRLAAGALGVTFLALSVPAHADAAYDACIRTAVSNVDFDTCGAGYIKRADTALNVAWKQTFGMVTGQSKTDLLAEQRAWLAFMNVSCKFYANGDYGREGMVISFPACRAEVIEDRAKDLVGIGKSLQHP